MKKILNLYCALGQNRAEWKNCEVTAVEINPVIARIYKLRFPNDNVIVGDAHDYLLQNFQNYDFIWASPPCTTHTKMRSYLNLKQPVYPDMKLYEEIIFLKKFYKGLYCIENVVPYYETLISPSQKIGRHLFWSNFSIPPIAIEKKKKEIVMMTLTDLSELHEIELSLLETLSSREKTQFLRNCVEKKIGQHIFDAALSQKAVNPPLLTLF